MKLAFDIQGFVCYYISQHFFSVGGFFSVLKESRMVFQPFTAKVSSLRQNGIVAGCPNEESSLQNACNIG